MNILTESLQAYFASFSINKAIMMVMMIFMIVGGIDRIRGNKLGYGEKFEEGFQALGSLATAMIGMIALVPVIKIVLGGVLGAFFKAIGADPSLFAGILLGCDLGGYPLAMELADSPAIGSYTGMIIAFGKGVTAVVTAGTMIAVFQYLTGIRFPLFHVMVEANAEGVIPLEDGFLVIGEIAIVLLGAFPMVAFITKKFSAPLQRLGGKFDLDENSVGGMIANLANNIMMFQMMKDMRQKGKILNCAFTVSACFVLGDHLGFVAGQNQQLIVPMMAAKFIGDITAVVLANILWKSTFSKSYA